MADERRRDGRLTRRGFLGGAAAVAACGMLPGRGLMAAPAAGKPNSVIDGVRIGCITYSFRSLRLGTAEATLEALLKCGLSEAELMGGPIQNYVKQATQGKKPASADARRELELAACRDLRKMYNDAGVTIHIHKSGFGRSDEDIEFNFLKAKALGCTGITLERNEAMAKRLAPFADKHKIWVAFHNHTGNVPVMDGRDPILEHGEYIGYNFDVGHYTAGTKGKSPIPVIEKYHDRMVSLHLKDRTAKGGNVPWGEGETPLKDILRLMRAEKWTFPADIELEYGIPKGSDAIKEVTRCVRFCREALA
jgi:sugar phosphate isomerase/epimerase